MRFLKLGFILILLLSSTYCFANNYEGFLPPGEKPIKVGVALFLNNVDYISEQQSTVKVEMTIYSTWQDSRLKFVPNNSEDVKIYTGDAAQDVFKTIWHPYLDIPERVGDSTIQQFLLKIHSDGTVTTFKKINIDIDLNSDVRKFPFDNQTGIINIVPFGYNKNEVELYKLTKFEGVSPGIVLPNWTMDYNFQTSIINFSHISDITPHSAYQFAIQFKRLSYPYLVQVILPLFVISLMSYLMMFTPIKVGDIFAVLITIILSMIAFQWLVVGQVPSGPYLNYTELIILISFMFCCAVMISFSIFEIIEKRFNKVARRRIEIGMRVFLALAYIIFNVAIIIYIFR